MSTSKFNFSERHQIATKEVVSKQLADCEKKIEWFLKHARPGRRSLKILLDEYYSHTKLSGHLPPLQETREIIQAKYEAVGWSVQWEEVSEEYEVQNLPYMDDNGIMVAHPEPSKHSVSRCFIVLS